MKKTWILPAIILVGLVAVNAFRWDHLAAKTSDYSIIKWKADRWTGQAWREIYRSASITETPILPGSTDLVEAWDKRNQVSNYWNISTGITIICLGYSLFLPRKKTEDSNLSHRNANH